jgi:hypothetical protein
VENTSTFPFFYYMPPESKTFKHFFNPDPQIIDENGPVRMKALCAVFWVLLCAGATLAQTATLTGHVTDESGAAVPGAKITLSGPDDLAKLASSNGEGAYSFAGLPPGNYSVTASAPALTTPQPARITLASGIQSLDLTLKIVAASTQVTVQANTATVSTEASNNANATVLSGEDLQALTDDPQDLQADLEALAGPSAGPSGNAIFIDGFTGGELPAKESIREVRLNSNHQTRHRPLSRYPDLQLRHGLVEFPQPFCHSESSVPSSGNREQRQRTHYEAQFLHPRFRASGRRQRLGNERRSSRPGDIRRYAV